MLARIHSLILSKKCVSRLLENLLYNKVLRSYIRNHKEVKSARALWAPQTAQAAGCTVTYSWQNGWTKLAVKILIGVNIRIVDFFF